MIKIVCDFYQLHQVETSRDMAVVNSIQDYIPLRQQLRRILDEETRNYTVYVQHRVIAQWLKDLTSYEPHIVEWEDVNLQTYFEQQFGFPPPKDLNEAAIQDLLHNLPSANGNAIADPVGWILSQRIDPVWKNGKPRQEHLVEFAAWILKVQAIPAPFKPLMKTRLMEWTKYDHRYQNFLEHSWSDVATSLFLRWILHRYPKDFTSSFQLFTSVPLADCSRYPDICIELVKAHQSSLRHFWNAWLLSSSSQEDIMVALQWMSGLADAELETIESWAREHQQHITDQLLWSIQERFLHHPRLTSVLERLEKLIAAALPSDIDPAWSVEQWLNWVTEEYFPYFAWVIRNNQPRNVQIDRAHQFEDWLIDIYPKLPWNSQASFSYHQLGRIKELFDTNTTDVILWFIVDGMTWWQGKKFVDFCAERNIEGISIQPTISVLPTITSISKKALVEGYLASSDTNLSIAQVLKDRFIREGKYIKVYTHSYALEQAFTSDLQPGLYALLYSSLDHQSHEEQGFTDNESIDGHLRLIARLTEEGFNNCLRQGLRVKAFISSDHGSTLLPKDARVLEIPDFAHILEDEDLLEENLSGNAKPVFRKSRVCAIEKVPNKHDLNALEKDWYYLQKDAFCLPKQMFIPKGYSAVTRRPRGWTHGGATPEEVVVASIEMQPSKIDFMDPVVTLTGFLLLHRISTLHITIGNANLFPIRVVQLVVADSLIEMRQRIISSNSTIKAEIDIPAVKSQVATYPIYWRLTCEGGGQRKEFIGQTAIPIRRLQVSDVDEMFEGML
jgi:hypothetical protein